MKEKEKEKENNSKKFVSTGSDVAYFNRNKSNTIPNKQTVSLVKKIHTKHNFSNVCEIGIGNGRNLKYLNTYFETVSGIDICKEAIEEARKLNPSMYIYNKNIADSKFKLPVNFDLVILGFVGYLLDDEEFKIAIKNIKSMLKPGGLFYTYDFWTDFDVVKPDKYNKKVRVYKRTLNTWLNTVDMELKHYSTGSIEFKALWKN